MGWKSHPYCEKALGREAVECQLCSNALELSTEDTGARPSPSQSPAAAGRPYSPWPDQTLRPSQPLSNCSHDPNSTHPSPGQETSPPSYKYHSLYPRSKQPDLVGNLYQLGQSSSPNSILRRPIAPLVGDFS